MGLAVEPPDVNASQWAFAVSGPRAIRYGLGAIKGVGEAAVAAMIEERSAHGPFRDLFDLCGRIDLDRVNRRVLEALVRSGALDGLGQNRATLMHALPQALQAADQSSRAAAAGQVDLFGLAAPTAAPAADARPVEVDVQPDWTDALRLAGERDTLGLYLTGHPIAEYEHELATIVSGRIAEVGGAKPVGGNEGGWRGPGRSVTVAGLVLEIRRRANRTSFVLDDRSGRIEITLFEDVLQQYRSLIVKDAILVVEGALRFDDFVDDWRIAAKRIIDVSQAREQYARRIVLRWPERADGRLLTELERALRDSRGGRCAIAIRYAGEGASANLLLGEDWSVKPSQQLIDRLTALFGRGAVELRYARTSHAA
jgi:DNA polymerase-3 subunit alpha